jgi:hypothetical protein
MMKESRYKNMKKFFVILSLMLLPGSVFVFTENTNTPPTNTRPTCEGQNKAGPCVAQNMLIQGNINVPESFIVDQGNLK